jgi:insulysin
LFIGGYNDKLPLLLEKIIDKMKNLQIKPERFVIIKEEIKRGFENYFLDEPYQHAVQNMSIALSDNVWTHEDILSEIKDIHMEDLQTSIPTIVSSLHIEGLAHGAVDRDQVISMFGTIESILQPRPLMPSQFIGDRDIILPAGQKFVYPKSVHDPENVNSAINYTSQVCSVKDIPLRNRLRMVAQIAEEPCFNQLRTREQLGYLVFSGVRCFISQMAFRLIIQSEKDPVYLENRCLEFLESLRTIIAEMSEADYQTQMDSLVAECLEKHKNLWEEGYKYWGDISSGYYEFDDTLKDVAEIKTITKESLLEFYDKWIMPDSPYAATMSVHLKSQKAPPAVSEVKDNYTVDQLYPVLTYLGLVNKKELSEDEFKTLVANYGGDTKIQSEVGLTEFLSSKLNISLQDVDQVIIKINQGPSGLSRRNHNQLPKGYTVIDDVIKFKRRMPLSAAPVPFYAFPNV